jgi:MFS family permease
VNISNANIFGLSKELDLAVNNRFNTALVIFFVPYVLFEIPSNIILKKLKPNVWLSICMFMFGLFSIIQGLVQNYAGLLVTRFFLGLFETGMFPGCEYLRLRLNRGCTDHHRLLPHRNVVSPTRSTKTLQLLL